MCDVDDTNCGVAIDWVHYLFSVAVRSRRPGKEDLSVTYNTVVTFERHMKIVRNLTTG